MELKHIQIIVNACVHDLYRQQNTRGSRSQHRATATCRYHRRSISAGAEMDRCKTPKTSCVHTSLVGSGLFISPMEGGCICFGDSVSAFGCCLFFFSNLGSIDSVHHFAPESFDFSFFVAVVFFFPQRRTYVCSTVVYVGLAWGHEITLMLANVNQQRVMPRSCVVHGCAYSAATDEGSRRTVGDSP
jgi:hypothetical protein